MVFEVAERRLADTTAPIDELLDMTLDRLESSTSGASRSPACPPATTTSTSCSSGCSRARSSSSAPGPAMGKTASRSASSPTPGSKAQRPVLLFSLEMSQLELTQRILCAEAKVDANADPQRQAVRGGLEQDRQRRRPSGRCADLHRRQPEHHGDGHPGQGPPSQEPHRRSRRRHRRLPPADERPAGRREPPGRGGRDQPRSQDPRP